MGKRIMIIALDPSGNWAEGKGTTGICKMDMSGKIIGVDEIKADEYPSPEDYWSAHISMLMQADWDSLDDVEVVMEGFRLYENKKSEQVNSQFETPQLIGVIRHWCFTRNIPLKLTYAVEVKSRWSDAVLEKKGFIHKKGRNRYLTSTGQRLNNHKTDAIRHAIHYYRYGRKES